LNGDLNGRQGGISWDWPAAAQDRRCCYKMKGSMRGDRTKNPQSDKRDYMRELNFDDFLVGWVLKVNRFQASGRRLEHRSASNGDKSLGSV
jgi:hypothetical protein